MDKEELIEMLNRHTYGQEEKKMDNDPRWITGMDPNKPGKYLTTALWKGDYIVTADHFDEDGWFLGGEVLAWMPLPPAYIPPKAEEPAEKKCENCFHFTSGACMVSSHDSNGTKTMVSSTDPTFSCKHWDEKGKGMPETVNV